MQKWAGHDLLLRALCLQFAPIEANTLSKRSRHSGLSDEKIFGLEELICCRRVAWMRIYSRTALMSACTINADPPLLQVTDRIS